MTAGSPIVAQLRAIQRAHGFIPAAELRELSERTSTPLSQLHEVVSFFPHFRIGPPPPVEVLVCDDLACHRRGGAALLAALQERVAGGPEVARVRPASCLGRCDRAPACAVNEAIVAPVTLERALAQVHAAAAGEPVHGEEGLADPRPLTVDPYDGPHARYAVARRLALGGDAAGVLAALKGAQLRGLGGAGLPTGLKWERVRDAPGPDKYVVGNAHESEPGGFKDRSLLERAPHLLVEGMLLAGLVTGARLGIVYVRHEHEPQLAIVEGEIGAARAAGVLGPSVFGSGRAFELQTFVSPGGYVGGEESALLETLEGRRGEPRNTPPLPLTHGLHDRPTLIHNVETFSIVPAILARGPEWFRAQGRNGAAGLKLVAVSGDVARPGVYEIGIGTPAREVIYERAGGVLGGRPLKAWGPSGPSSGFLPAAMLDVPLDVDALARAGARLGSGAMFVLSDQACMLDMALNAVRFFRNESCGKCVPCRVGSAKMVDVLTDIARGRGGAEHLAMIDDLSHVLVQTSLCGLGQMVPMPIRSVLTHFREDLDDHLRRRRCAAGVCPVLGG
jgi:NADH:ubiquinone oxidoreductase subunit F (NADH-binding)/NADH:ubiquinone oxidoreductase subunit E